MRTAYVAGKISGIPMEAAQEKFNYIANQLVNKGYTVVNPITEADYNKTWDDAVRGEIKKMLECDEVHMLHDWQESRGAMLERDIALRLGMEVVYH
ncbi:MAG: hypothetical protein K0Q79_1994 [Flavipsychrobacter sp.]|jgi:hypothetical protein|nr:hypothetical protein [Flavipsychrobacter sp.]